MLLGNFFRQIEMQISPEEGKSDRKPFLWNIQGDQIWRENFRPMGDC
jgi:hypothetical protein